MKSEVILRGSNDGNPGLNRDCGAEGERGVLYQCGTIAQRFPRHKVARFSTEVFDSPYYANMISLISNSARDVAHCAAIP